MDHLDIEQDNNPSLYGTSFHDDQYFNNTLNLLSALSNILNSPYFEIEIKQTEKLINSSIIVYLIVIKNTQTEESITVKRRYSEFKSLRDNLLKLYPIEIIPPIPEKHSLISYVWNSLNAHDEIELIDFRRRFFHRFLNDLMKIKYLASNPFLHKFLDPNYELCWNNALNEPPISNLPKDLLLSNPLNPNDPNSLYLLLPKINSFHNNQILELYKLNLDPLSRINDTLLKLSYQINFTKFPVNKFVTIPDNIIKFESYILNNLKVFKSLEKHSLGHIKNFKSLLSILIHLGGNLNNFSLEIHELNLQLSNLIEKFGSIIDANFINFENFLHDSFIPFWHECVSQIHQYYNIALNLLNFYKFKIYQFRILFHTKFSLFNQLTNLNSSLNLNDLHHLSELNSPSIHRLVSNYQTSKSRLLKKKSWFRVFGGNNVSRTPITPQGSQPESSSPEPTQDSPEDSTGSAQKVEETPELKHKIDHLERELNKLDQLIELMDHDLVALTEKITIDLGEFVKIIETKWLSIFLDFIQSTKQLFIENLNNWQDFKLAFEN